MASGLTLGGIAALFGVMLVGALVRSVSVLAVSARSAAFGFAHGVCTSLGIVVGDIVFILIAIYGLSVLAELMGNHYPLIRYFGGIYLIWLGVALWRSKAKAEGLDGDLESSLLSSFLTGLLITLGDQKAILFYLGFSPAFIDLPAVSFFETSIIIIAIVAVGGAKLAYAYTAGKAGSVLKSARVSKGINVAAGGVMMGVGVSLFLKA